MIDWEKFGDYRELFKHMNKCVDIIDAYDAIEKKGMSLVQRMDYDTSKCAFQWRAFGHAAMNLLEGHNSDEFLTVTLKYIKNSNLFQDALSIISKLDQKDYETALQNLDRFSKSYRKPAYRVGEGYLPVSLLPSTNIIYRDNYTSIKEYPSTIEQFKNEMISLLVGHGVNIDINEANKTKSICQSLKAEWANLKYGYQSAYHGISLTVPILNHNRGYERNE